MIEAAPYLRRLLAREGGWVAEAMADPSAALADLLATLDPSEAGLRRAKARAHLLIARADLEGVWDLPRVTGALTRLADAAVRAAADGIGVIAMGKMGAHELNYSSDIDLVLIDQGGGPAAGRALVRRLSAPTAQGYVFRVDLRLRPDPGSTPIVVPRALAERYFHHQGRSWERAAWLKARPVAGAEAEALVAEAQPFVWRRQLDFALAEDATQMQATMASHNGAHSIGVEGHDLKLGRGGIRAIEFYAQTRQLIAGGRDARLRVRGTVEALARLAATGRIPGDTAARLTALYTALRTLEHRVQMLEDAQTHSVPRGEGFRRLAALCDMPADALAAHIRATLEEVHALTAPPEEPALPAAPPIPAAWAARPALRAPRARRQFARIWPDLCARLATAHDPGAAERAFGTFLSGLSGGVRTLSLLAENPRMLRVLVDTCAAAPRLARALGQRPAVLDAMLDADFWDAVPPLPVLQGALALPEDFEAALDAARRWAEEMRFRIGLRLLHGAAGPEETAAAFSAVAEAALRALWPRVVADIARRHGPPPGQGAALLALGKLGSREMTATSDLDLILVYDAPAEGQSAGPRPVPVPVWYARLTQAVVRALSAPMGSGVLYEVDMRLRPSGKAGPVAVALASFEAYHRGTAWLWEAMALTRARVVAGDPPVAAALAAALADLRRLPRDPADLRAAAADMRARLLAEHPGATWGTRDGPGRLRDIELAVQAQALIHGVRRRRPAAMLGPLTGPALTAGQAEALGQAMATLSSLQQIGRVATGGDPSPADGPALMARVLALTGAPDAAALEARLAAETAAAAEVVAAL